MHPNVNIFITDDTDELGARIDLFENVWSCSSHLSKVYRSPEAELIEGWNHLVEVSKADWDGFFRLLVSSPSILHKISPRKFEESVAELLARSGMEVRLTPYTKDGGRDIIATPTGAIGDFLYLVECKHYRPDFPVGISLVCELYGIVEMERATAGILFTTSRFTSSAQAFRDTVKHRLSLRDYIDLIEWITRMMDN